MLVVEDLHWVDAASVEVLRFLARRIETMPLRLLVDLPRPTRSAPGTRRARCSATSLASTAFTTLRLAAALARRRASSSSAAPRSDPERVHALTGGNPFFVTEVAKDPDLPLPGSVRDAVLARTPASPPDDFEVLQLAAAAPDRLDDRLLPALGRRPADASAAATTPAAAAHRRGLVFRHELARQAVESTIPPAGSRGCTPGCWTPSSGSSPATRPS